MKCAWCRRTLDYVHGHAACLHHGCPMFGLNQGECCTGETGDDRWTADSDIAAATGGQPPPTRTDDPQEDGAGPGCKPNAP